MKAQIALAIALGVASCKEPSRESKAGTTKPFPEVPESSLEGIARTRLDHPNPSPAQLARRERSRLVIAELGAPFLEDLPVVEDAKTIEPRPAKEIAGRAIAVAIAAVKGEGLEQNRVEEIVEQLEARALLTPDERKFVFDPAPTDKDRAKFGWRYEGLDVLLWALGFRDSLPAAHTIMDPATDVGIVRKNAAAGLIAKAKPRTMDELLDMADLYYCLHWAAIELRIHGKTNERVNEEIIMERHYALNWLIRYMDQDWDHVTTDT